MIRSKISSAKNAMIGPEDMLKSADSPNDKKAAQVYLELERRLRAANAMDFDDLLVRALELLRTRPEVLDKYQERFRYISAVSYTHLDVYKRQGAPRYAYLLRRCRHARQAGARLGTCRPRRCLRR